MLKNKIKQMRAEGGFTFPELLIVILIIGFLATLAFVAFQGSTDNAKNVTAQGNLRSALAVANSEKVANSGSYPAAGTLVTKITQSGLKAEQVAAGVIKDDTLMVYPSPDTGEANLKMAYKVSGGTTYYTIVTSAGTYNGTSSTGS